MKQMERIGGAAGNCAAIVGRLVQSTQHFFHQPTNTNQKSLILLRLNGKEIADG